MVRPLFSYINPSLAVSFWKRGRSRAQHLTSSPQSTVYKKKKTKNKKQKTLSFPSCYRRNTRRFLSMVLMMLEMWLHSHGKRSNRETQIYWHFPTLLEQRHSGSVSGNLNLMRFFIVAIVFNLQRFTNILLRKEKPRIVILTYWRGFCFFFFFFFFWLGEE